MGGIYVPEGYGGAITHIVELPVIPPPEGCEPMSEYSDDLSCQIDISCGDIWAMAWCSTTDTGRATCDCEADKGYQSFQLAGVNAGTSCGYVLGLCMGTVTLPELSEPVCSRNHRGTDGDTYCSLDDQCVAEAPIVEGASIISLSSRSYYCSSYADDGGAGDAWDCVCDSMSGREATVGFELPKTMAALDACTTTQDVCRNTSALVPAGPTSCVPDSDSSYTTSCSAQLACTQPVVSGDLTLSLSQSLFVDCQPGTGTDWDCACSLGMDSTTLTVTPPADIFETCGVAATSCREALTGAAGASATGA